MSSKPNLTGFLNGALNPLERSKLRAVDHEALEEVFEADSLRPKPRPPVIWPKPRFEHDPDREHWSKSLPEPLEDDDLAAIPTRYEVRVLDSKGRFSKGPRSCHRVSPKALFGLKYTDFPSEYQISVADMESRLCAQRAGWEYLLEGARRVEISSYRRKSASSRFSAGPVVTYPVAVMKSISEEPWVLGEPSEKALEIDAGYGI